MSFDDFIQAKAMLVSYENEGEDTGSDGDGTDTNEETESTNTSETSTQNRVFDQEAVNKMLAADRRRHRQQLEKVEHQYQALLANSQLTQEQRDELETNLQEVQKQLRTKEELAKQEKAKLQKQYESELQAEREARLKAEQKYSEEVITRALSDASHAADAYNPQQIVNLLRGKTRLVDDKPVVDFDDVSTDTNEPVVLQISPAEAVKRMSEKHEWANLFNNNLVKGIGGNSATGGAGGSGNIDPRSLSPEDYIKMRRANPKSVPGLK